MRSRLSVVLQLTLFLGAIAAAPTAKLDNATIVGYTNASVTSFMGIPFAEPPVGDLRLRLPKPIVSYNGTINATQPCNAGFASSNGVPQSEDCLTINVQVPEGTQPGAKLPVLAFIFGGGFTIGSSAQMTGDTVVQRSIALGQPVVFAAMNYRLHAFGFLGGKEVKEAGIGNLGLQDQREALRWIKKHIAVFGGDPDKVTIWGPSSGADLDWPPDGHEWGNHRPPVPRRDHELWLAPAHWRYHAPATTTTQLSSTLDALFAAAATLPNLFDYQGLASPWAPRADGVFLKAVPQHLVLSGSVADIPFITGDALDEGTVFASGSFNVTTEDQFHSYVHQIFFPLAQGDVMFQAPRRFFLDQRSPKQNTWAFINERGRSGGLGIAHGSDFSPALLGPDERVTDYIVQFTATQDPNGASNRTIFWPKYDTSHRMALHIVDEGLNIGNDSLRLAAMEGLTALSVAFPL